MEWKGVEHPSEKPLNILQFKGLEKEENLSCPSSCPDPDLQSLIDAWPELSEKAKKKILRILDTSDRITTRKEEGK